MRARRVGRYEDAANGIDLDDSFQLTQEVPEITWKRFRMDEALDSYLIRRVFHAADNRDRVIEWTEVDQERLTIRNPVPKGRTAQDPMRGDCSFCRRRTT